MDCFELPDSERHSESFKRESLEDSLRLFGGHSSKRINSVCPKQTLKDIGWNLFLSWFFYECTFSVAKIKIRKLFPEFRKVYIMETGGPVRDLLLPSFRTVKQLCQLCTAAV